MERLAKEEVKLIEDELNLDPESLTTKALVRMYNMFNENERIIRAGQTVCKEMIRHGCDIRATGMLKLLQGAELID